MYKAVEDRIRKALRHHIHERYKTDVPIVTERPPKLSMGEVASPVCFELAKRLKKPPRALAQEIANSLKPIGHGAGGGGGRRIFERVFRPRGIFSRRRARKPGSAATAARRECDRRRWSSTPASIRTRRRTSGICAMRCWATRLRAMLRYTGRRVEVQNYIDNTGVQVADVVLGFLHLEKKSLEEVRALAARRKFDYLCWDLYARVTQFLAEDKARLELRGQTLKEIEEGHGDAARMAEMVSTAISSLPSAHAGPAGNRLRFAVAGKRNSALEILGCGV